MAIGKLQGVESVDVSLQRPSADIRLRPGNVVTLTKLREIIRDNGFSPRDVRVTVLGAVVERGGAPALEVSGLNVVWTMARDPKQPQAYDDASARLKAKQSGAVEVIGVVHATKNTQQPEQIVVTAIRAVTP